MGVLATIGATSPFVGLFGTVWGIMNSFIGHLEIADHQPRRGGAGHRGRRCSHAVRSGGRDPAVIIYNHFSRVTKGYLELVGRASGAGGAAVVARPRPHPRQRAC